jgi:hypothetical protein
MERIFKEDLVVDRIGSEGPSMNHVSNSLDWQLIKNKISIQLRI